MNDNWKKDSARQPGMIAHADNDITALAVIAAALLRLGTTKSAVPREAAIMLKELKKAYAQENPGQ